MNQYTTSDIALLKGLYKAKYIKIMGNVMNSNEPIEVREKILTDVLQKLIYAQENDLPVDFVLNETLMKYSIKHNTEKPVEKIKTEIVKRNPPFPFFYLALTITITAIVYFITHIQDLYNLQVNIYPEFVLIPFSIIVGFILYYCISVAKLHNNTAAFLFCIALAPIYLGIVCYLYITKPFFFSSTIGTIPIYVVFLILATVWSITLVTFIRRKKREHKRKLK